MKKLSLQKLSSNELEKREMNQLLGGGTPGMCGCGCNYNLIAHNGSANGGYGYTESAGGTNYCACGGNYLVDYVSAVI